MGLENENLAAIKREAFQIRRTCQTGACDDSDQEKTVQHSNKQCNGTEHCPEQARSEEPVLAESLQNQAAVWYKLRFIDEFVWLLP
jgi:hypothetical protein